MLDELAPPPGFSLRESGLIVPRSDAPPLEREQWTEAEAKVIRRAFTLLRRKDLLAILGCRDKRCSERPEVAERYVPGGFALVCQHKERLVLQGR